jgi:hypothetical protein
MTFDFIIITLVGILLLFAAYTVYQLLRKFPKRTIDDVTPFLRPAESEELESLLDPAQETAFRLRMHPREFAGWQRKRILLMREYLLRMSHNALVLIEWGNMEAGDGDGEQLRCNPRQLLAREMVQAATEFRLYSMLALAKLTFWLILPSPVKFMFPSPSLPSLRNIFGISALGSYQRLKTAASGLSLTCGSNFHSQLLERL